MIRRYGVRQRRFISCRFALRVDDGARQLDAAAIESGS
jgi:hypothetical protein